MTATKTMLRSTSEYLVTDLTTGHSEWKAAYSAAEAVIRAEAAAGGSNPHGLKASHRSSGDLIDVSCGRFAVRGVQERIFRQYAEEIDLATSKPTGVTYPAAR